MMSIAWGLPVGQTFTSGNCCHFLLLVGLETGLRCVAATHLYCMKSFNSCHASEHAVGYFVHALASMAMQGRKTCVC
jgi:hypothetical protein